jgi:hypothetical protein
LIIDRLCTLHSAGQGILTERGRLSTVDKLSLVSAVRENHPTDPGLASQLHQNLKKVIVKGIAVAKEVKG